jgi:catalase
MSDDKSPVVTTTDTGVAAPSDEFSLSARGDGRLLLQDQYLIQKMGHFNRERVPEHVVQAKGRGAFDFFEATEDVASGVHGALVAGT